MTRNHAKPRRLRLLLPLTVFAVVLMATLRSFTSHTSETVLLVMPPVLGAGLWYGWRDVRRTPLWTYGFYLVLLLPIIAGAEAIAARAAGGRVLWAEVWWALYFLVAWRMAWAIWSRTVGRLGERLRRWRRSIRFVASTGARLRSARQRRLAAITAAIPAVRIALVAFVFAPLLVGSLIHRFKIGNPTELAAYAHLPIEPVAFDTSDGLRLSGWFLPDGHSDATVIVAHGLGANKGNFVAFLTLFFGQGYNSLIFDFRGHGDSDGHTTTFGLHESADVLAALDWLKRERPERARHVFGLGSSMGAMALVRAASVDARIEAIVLDSAYVTAARLAEQHLDRLPILGSALAPVVLGSLSLHAGRSMWDLDGCEAIAKLSPRPVLLIHAKGDSLIPPIHMDWLYDCACEPKTRWLGPGTHSNILSADFNAYQNRIIQFLDQARAR